MRKTTTLALLTVAMLVITIFSAPFVSAATEEEVEASIERGLEYLATHQNPDGSWGDQLNWYELPATTGLVLVKLQMRAYEIGYDSPFDPDYNYSVNVLAGWNYLFDNAIAKISLSLQDHTGGASGTIDDPDTNGNGYGICFTPEETYSTGICLMALAATGTPDRPNDGGIDYDGDANVDTYKQLAQDTADWLAWAQGDLAQYQGGYYYEELDNAGGWADNSNTGYAYLGLAAAEGFGCTVPEWVRTELNAWITTIQDPVNGDQDDGGSWYNPDWWYQPWVNELKTGNLIFEMTFFGDDGNVQRFKDAIAYIVRHWQDQNVDPGWGYNIQFPDWQALFCLMKGFEYSGIDLIDLDGDSTPEHDWYEEFSTVIVNKQNPDGSWTPSRYGNVEINTAWALLTLEKFAPPPPVIIVYVDIKPGSWPNPINIGSKGVFAVAICGTEDFDVMTIDPATVKIYIEGVEEGVSPLRWSFEDVATPYIGPPGGGHALNGDGFLDLVFHFDTQAVVIKLHLANYVGQTIPLIIRGNLNEASGGTGIQGQDYVRIQQPPILAKLKYSER